jgi:L-aspartate oxidase
VPPGKSGRVQSREQARMSQIDTDVLVIGSGIAGLTFALRVAEHADVVLVTKKASLESNTNYAQGGIAAVVDSADSYQRHIEDTLHAGAGLCHRDRVEALVRSGPHAVADLIDWGVRFSRTGERLALGIEGGHSRKRIVHSRDHTGAAIEEALDEAVDRHPRIRLLEDHMVLSLRVGCVGGRRRCLGAWVLDIKGCRRIEVCARATMLAAGGSAAIYRHTTNPAIATGDGVALGYRAGASIANMEFIQFHPTALYPAEEHAFLISEAVRGEGAVLRNWDGEAFMARYDRRKDLAPRDIVARAVHSELKESGKPHVWLDATEIPGEHLEERFPKILEHCRARGVDPCHDPIPVVPAAHYTCGGTALAGLYAAGECACTGVHGANRLASNSLLEAVVFAGRAASRMIRNMPPAQAPQSVDSERPLDLSAFPAEPLAQLRTRLRRLMWDHLGIVRSRDEMHAGEAQLEGLRHEWLEMAETRAGRCDGARWTEAAELRNMLDVAGLVVRCALWRRESRGLHFVVDYPDRDNESYLRDSFLIPTD